MELYLGSMSHQQMTIDTYNPRWYNRTDNAATRRRPLSQLGLISNICFLDSVHQGDERDWYASHDLLHAMAMALATAAFIIHKRKMPRLDGWHDVRTTLQWRLSVRILWLCYFNSLTFAAYCFLREINTLTTHQVWSLCDCPLTIVNMAAIRYLDL